jgi:hypothetical protein
MLAILVACLLLCLSYFVYKWVIRPMKLNTSYGKHFRDRGFSVVELPFRPYSAPFHVEIRKDEANRGDPFYKHKREYCSVDVIITNILGMSSVICTSPELIKEATSP